MRRDSNAAGWQAMWSTGHDDLGETVERMIGWVAAPAEMPGDAVDLAVPIRIFLR